ncbi:MAG: hypothetical protein IJ689_05710 [Alphaproteobacteria bacterium]|nr:hypothetical protein [Alphaproteobacteria bacterium]
MTNKTFLIFLLAGVSYTAYNAAAVSENFAISTTIDHEITLGGFKAASADANLNITTDLQIGTIVIDKDKSSGSFWVGTGVYEKTGGVVEVNGYHPGLFTSDVEYSGGSYELDSRFSVAPATLVMGKLNVTCQAYHNHYKTNSYFMGCRIRYSEKPDVGSYSGVLTITYNG